MWYQTGLVLDLSTLTAPGALRALLLDSTYEHDPADSLADVALVESTGGAYARVDVAGVTLDTGTPGQARLMSSTPTSFARPTSTPGWVVMYRVADSALVLAAEFLDPTLDPIVVGWDDDVIGVRIVGALVP